MFQDLNYLAILASAAAYWVLGGIWYAAIFSKQYQKGLNFNEEEKALAQKGFPKALAMHFVAGLLTALVVSTITRANGAATLASGILCGFWPWLGFVCTTQTNLVMFERRNISLFLIDVGFYLIAFSVMGGILALWR